MQNKIGGDMLIVSREWIVITWMISPAHGVHTAGQCDTHWDFSFSKRRRNGFGWILFLIYITPSSGIF